VSFQSFRERVNLLLYDSKDIVLKRMRVIGILISFLGVCTLIYYHGYTQTATSEIWVQRIITTSFTYYIIYYCARIFYDFKPRAFLKRTWFQGVMVLLLLIEGISFNITGELLLERIFNTFGIGSVSSIENFFIQIYFFLMIVVELTKSTGSILPRIKFHPAVIFIISFLIIIASGTGLLMMPEMTTNGISFLDALFTSTSATCVTGLMVENIDAFTFKGQVVLLVLIKVGGLNIIAFGCFIALAARIGLGIKHHEVIEDFINKDSIISAKGMLGRIILWSFIIELVGAALIYAFWLEGIPFESVGDKVFSSLFHAISAFNNAGISLCNIGIYEDFVILIFAVHFILALLIFFGAIGFNAIFDIFSLKNIKNRLRNPWKHFAFSTKIALYFSLFLVVLGTVAFFFLEQDNSLSDAALTANGEEMGIMGELSHSLFQSVNRTSGFSTIDYHTMSTPMIIMVLFLMFVGASSSSTGGGIKTSTFAVLWASTISTIRGRKHVQLFKRTLTNELVLRAFSVLIFFIVGNLVCIFLLTITETDILNTPGRGILDLMFEEVSALGTVGLSTGITGDLSSAGRIIIIVSMFVGRVGTLTVAYAIGKSVISTKYKYPKGHTMVG